MMINRFLDITPRQVFQKLGLIKQQEPKKSEAPKVVFPAPSCSYSSTNRRAEGGQLKNLPSDYLAKQKDLLSPLMKKVWDNRKLEDSFLKVPEFTEIGERIVEYPFVLAKMIELASKSQSLYHLDVGCVLNNSIIKDYVSKLSEMIWFLNPSVEPFQYNNNMGYIVSDIRKHRIPPSSITFDLVTCLSTLEHVGMDNIRYGGGKAEFEGYCEDPEKFAMEATKRLLPLVKPKGRLLISVPFGPFEYVYIYGKPNEPIYYTFNKEKLLALKECLVGFKSEIIIYKVIPGKGWYKASIDEDNEILKHAVNCAGAGAVAFIDAQRID